nr:AlpA family phage regulatory protein [Roseococcus suduntuyensis]
MRREQAAAYVGMSPALFVREVETGALPRPIALAGTVKGWVRDDLDAWIDDRRAAQSVEVNTWD